MIKNLSKGINDGITATKECMKKEVEILGRDINLAIWS